MEKQDGKARLKLAGKIAVVTGTNPNIMGGIAEGLAEQGADIVCVDINPEYSAACARTVVAKGRRSLAVACDVTDEAQVVAAMDRTREAFGGVDVLVNGATVFNYRGVLDMPVEEWRRQTDVILTGAFLFTKHAAKLMIEQGRRGNVINVISTAGHQGEPGNVGYGTGKGGLITFTRSVAMELAKYGIRVNSLTPTATDGSEATERAARWGVVWPTDRAGERAKGLLPDARTGTPLQQLPSPKHYAQAAAFLASDESEMITGTDLRVDAGAVAKYWVWNPGAASS